MQSKIVLREASSMSHAELDDKDHTEITLVKFRDDPTMLIMSKGSSKISMELDPTQLMQLSLFINILLETR